MPISDVKIVLHDRNFEQLLKGLKDKSQEPEIAEAWQRVERLYKGYLRKRFATRSRNQGRGGIGYAWPQLKLETIKQRRPAAFRKKKKKAKKKAVKKAKKAKKVSKPTKPKRITVKQRIKKAGKTVKTLRKTAKKKVKDFQGSVKRFKQERKAKAKRKAVIRKISILRDTGAMFAVFQPEIVNVRGVFNPRDRLKLQVAFGGSGVKNGVSLDKLLLWHHTGAGRLPVRTLIVGLDQATARAVSRIFENAMRKVLKRSGR
jgi:hypothetical protein